MTSRVHAQHQELCNTTFYKWRHDAKCVTVELPSPDYFFPRTDVGEKKVAPFCVGCPTQVECLEYAVVCKEEDGVWGGLTSKERVRARRYVRAQFSAKSAEITDPIELSQVTRTALTTYINTVLAQDRARRPGRKKKAPLAEAEPVSA